MLKRSPEFFISLGVMLFVGIMTWQTMLIETPAYARVGARTGPLVLMCIMAVLSLYLLYEALKGGWQEKEEREAVLNKRNLLWVIAGLVLNVALISEAGFAIASIAMFVCIARAYGSNQPIRDALIATAFALIAYFGFVKVLGINIGGGLIENALESLIKGVK
jgi:putative tricarboxylic transport membrane protein